jgi:phage gp36-like protein
MSYITRQQLTDRYGYTRLVQLTDREDPPTGTIDDDVLNRAIADIDALIDGFLAGRFALPLPSVPGLLVSQAAPLVLEALYVEAAPDKVTADAANARKNLAAIAQGTVKLPIAGIEPAPAQSTGVLMTETCGRTFGRDAMKVW